MRRRTNSTKPGYVRALLLTGLVCLALPVSSVPASADQRLMGDITADTSVGPRHLMTSAEGGGRQITVKTASGATTTINPLDFFRRTAPEKTLQGFKRGPSDKEWEQPWGMQSYVEPYEGRFYYVKNIEPGKLHEYERFKWNDSYVGLERDTGWPPEPQVARPTSYDALEGTPLEDARAYAKTTNQNPGESVTYRDVKITGWDDGHRKPKEKCQYGPRTPYEEKMELKYYPKINNPSAENNFGGDLGVQEAISITSTTSTQTILETRRK
jgi:hypothetical protein